MMNLMRKMRVAKAVMTWTANHTGLPFTKKIFINGFKDVDTVSVRFFKTIVSSLTPCNLLTISFIKHPHN